MKTGDRGLKSFLGSEARVTASRGLVLVNLVDAALDSPGGIIPYWPEEFHDHPGELMAFFGQ